jgi:hypothetical protein
MKKGGIQPNQVYNEGVCDMAVSILGAGKSIARLASSLGVCRETIYEWREKHPEFDKAFKQGKEAAQAYWEDIGEDGVMGITKNFSASAWIFTMKNRFREDYRDDKDDKKDDAVSVLEKIISGELKVKHD